jgi:hypothetical protein
MVHYHHVLMLHVLLRAGLTEHFFERIHVSGSDMLPCCFVQPAGGPLMYICVRLAWYMQSPQ